MLFLRMAERLSRMHGYEVSVVDYPDGAMGSAPRSDRVALIPYGDDIRVPLPRDALVVFQSMTPWSVFPSLRVPPDARLFFWTLHPFNLIPVMPGIRDTVQSNPVLGWFVLSTILRGYRNRMVRFADFLLEKKALVFMDRSTLVNTELYLGTKIGDPHFMPICGGEPAPGPRGAIVGNRSVEGLRLCWIGRIADFKIHVLRRTLTDLDRVQPTLNMPIRFTMIGSGKYAAEIRSEAAGWHNLSVEFVNELPLAEITPYLRDNVDVLFAMGTSVLEAAAIGVPAILLDVSYGPVPQGYAYTWLHERTGYTLGDVLSPAHIRLGGHSLWDVLEGYLRDPAMLSERAYRYYVANHSPDVTVRAFVDYALQSVCHFSDYEEMGFARRDMVYEGFAALRKRLVQG